MSHNLLIVDDSAITRAVIKRTVKMCGVPLGQVLEAGSGKAALDALAAAAAAAAPVDLVLTDLNMPEMDGFEMVRRMAADPALAGVPVVVISSEPSAKQFAAAQPGVRGCLAKPFTPEHVRTVLLDALGVANG